MRRAMSETERRRVKQLEFNQANGIVPKGVVKEIRELIDGVYDASQDRKEVRAAQTLAQVDQVSEQGAAKENRRLEKLMLEHARNLEFEKAAQVRDPLARLNQRVFGASGADNVIAFPGRKPAGR